MHLLAAIETTFGDVVDPELLLDARFTLAHLAHVVRRRGRVSQSVARDAADTAEDLMRTTDFSLLYRKHAIARADALNGFLKDGDIGRQEDSAFKSKLYDFVFVWRVLTNQQRLAIVGFLAIIFVPANSALSFVVPMVALLLVASSN